MKLRIALFLVAWLLIGVACGEDGFVLTTGSTSQPGTSTTGADTTLEVLADACNDGVFAACDELWVAADVGSDLERVGATCGGLVDDIGDEAPFGDCLARFDETTTSTVTIVPPDSEFQVDPRNNTWTVILRSIEEDRGAEEAIGYAEELSGKGIAASVFLSNKYPSLNSGYWVVYTGEFADPDSASALCSQLTEEGIDCYHRFVGDQ